MSETLFDEWNTTVEPQTSTLIPMPEKKQHTPMTNPCLAKFGAGEEGVSCRYCVHLRYDQGYRRKLYWCDELASWKDGKPEHMIGWQSCTRYEQRKEPYYGG